MLSLIGLGILFLLGLICLAELGSKREQRP